MSKEAKSLYVKQEILADAEDNSLCDRRCGGFIDKICVPTFETDCKMFAIVGPLSLYSVFRDKEGFLVAKFTRGIECRNKEIK